MNYSFLQYYSTTYREAKLYILGKHSHYISKIPFSVFLTQFVCMSSIFLNSFLCEIHIKAGIYIGNYI